MCWFSFQTSTQILKKCYLNKHLCKLSCSNYHRFFSRIAPVSSSAIFAGFFPRNYSQSSSKSFSRSSCRNSFRCIQVVFSRELLRVVLFRNLIFFTNLQKYFQRLRIPSESNSEIPLEISTRILSRTPLAFFVKFLKKLPKI